MPASKIIFIFLIFISIFSQNISDNNTNVKNNINNTPKQINKEKKKEDTSFRLLIDFNNIISYERLIEKKDFRENPYSLDQQYLFNNIIQDSLLLNMQYIFTDFTINFLFKINPNIFNSLIRNRLENFDSEPPIINSTLEERIFFSDKQFYLSPINISLQKVALFEEIRFGSVNAFINPYLYYIGTGQHGILTRINLLNFNYNFGITRDAIFNNNNILNFLKKNEFTLDEDSFVDFFLFQKFGYLFDLGFLFGSLALGNVNFLTSRSKIREKPLFYIKITSKAATLEQLFKFRSISIFLNDKNISQLGYQQIVNKNDAVKESNGFITYRDQTSQKYKSGEIIFRVELEVDEDVDVEDLYLIFDSYVGVADLSYSLDLITWNYVRRLETGAMYLPYNDLNGSLFESGVSFAGDMEISFDTGSIIIGMNLMGLIFNSYNIFERVPLNKVLGYGVVGLEYSLNDLNLKFGLQFSPLVRNSRIKNRASTNIARGIKSYYEAKDTLPLETLFSDIPFINGIKRLVWQNKLILANQPYIWNDNYQFKVTAIQKNGTRLIEENFTVLAEMVNKMEYLLNVSFNRDKFLLNKFNNQNELTFKENLQIDSLSISNLLRTDIIDGYPILPGLTYFATNEIINSTGISYEDLSSDSILSLNNYINFKKTIDSSPEIYEFKNNILEIGIGNNYYRRQYSRNDNIHFYDYLRDKSILDIDRSISMLRRLQYQLYDAGYSTTQNRVFGDALLSSKITENFIFSALLTCESSKEITVSRLNPSFNGGRVPSLNEAVEYKNRYALEGTNIYRNEIFIFDKINAIHEINFAKINTYGLSFNYIALNYTNQNLSQSPNYTNNHLNRDINVNNQTNKNLIKIETDNIFLSQVFLNYQDNYKNNFDYNANRSVSDIYSFNETKITDIKQFKKINSLQEKWFTLDQYKIGEEEKFFKELKSKKENSNSEESINDDLSDEENINDDLSDEEGINDDLSDEELGKEDIKTKLTLLERRRLTDKYYRFDSKILPLWKDEMGIGNQFEDRTIKNQTSQNSSYNHFKRWKFSSLLNSRVFFSTFNYDQLTTAGTTPFEIISSAVTNSSNNVVTNNSNNYSYVEFTSTLQRNLSMSAGLLLATFNLNLNKSTILFFPYKYQEDNNINNPNRIYFQADYIFNINYSFPTNEMVFKNYNIDFSYKIEKEVRNAITEEEGQKKQYRRAENFLKNNRSSLKDMISYIENYRTYLRFLFSYGDFNVIEYDILNINMGVNANQNIPSLDNIRENITNKTLAEDSFINKIYYFNLYSFYNLDILNYILFSKLELKYYLSLNFDFKATEYNINFSSKIKPQKIELLNVTYRASMDLVHNRFNRVDYYFLGRELLLKYYFNINVNNYLTLIGRQDIGILKIRDPDFFLYEEEKTTVRVNFDVGIFKVITGYSNSVYRIDNTGDLASFVSVNYIYRVRYPKTFDLIANRIIYQFIFTDVETLLLGFFSIKIRGFIGERIVNDESFDRRKNGIKGNVVLNEIENATISFSYQYENVFYIAPVYDFTIPSHSIGATFIYKMGLLDFELQANYNFSLGNQISPEDRTIISTKFRYRFAVDSEEISEESL